MEWISVAVPLAVAVVAGIFVLSAAILPLGARRKSEAQARRLNREHELRGAVVSLRQDRMFDDLGRGMVTLNEFEDRLSSKRDELVWRTARLSPKLAEQVRGVLAESASWSNYRDRPRIMFRLIEICNSLEAWAWDTTKPYLLPRETLWFGEVERLGGDAAAVEASAERMWRAGGPPR